MIEKNDTKGERVVRKRTRKNLGRIDDKLGKYIEEVMKCNDEEVKWMKLLERMKIQNQVVDVVEVDMREEMILQEFLIRFYCGWVKAMDKYSISRFKVFQKIVKDSKEKTPLDQLEWVHIFFILGKIKSIHRILTSCEILDLTNTYIIWQNWYFLFTKKLFSSSSSSLSNPISLYSKIGNIYCQFNSFTWNSTEKAISLTQTSNLNDLEPIIIADLLLSSDTKESYAISLLTSSLTGPYGKLAFFRLLKHYLEYNSYELGQILCVYTKHKLQGEICDISSAYFIKILGKNKKVSIPTPSDCPLAHYFFVRACVKYNLKGPLESIKSSFKYLISISKLLNFTMHVFDIRFWQFLMYNKEKMELKAEKIARKALLYKSTSDIKEKALVRFIEDCKGKKMFLENLDFTVMPKRIGDFSEYLQYCIRLLVEIKTKKPKSLDIFEKVLECPIRFEGILINWFRAYEVNKIRYEKVKDSDTEKEDKQDPNHPLFYYKVFKEYLKLIIKAENKYFHIDINALWRVFGKDYPKLSLQDSFFLIQFKSYLRTNLTKSIKKIKASLESTTSSPFLRYFYIKYKLHKLKAQSKHLLKPKNNLFSFFTTDFFSFIGTKYTAKCHYFQSELYFLNKDFKKSLSSYKDSKTTWEYLNGDYLKNKKRTLTLESIEEKIIFQKSDLKNP
ncbi:hypothetical protein SteCoe_34000 [Stentor coeruleus]|uniref:Uncharacterized protein n=1 Tax=Stentor coeruleus TaxID=5963 RepID=A0A1R2AVN9_9CILI|nr:hypothetical protein SteCoe_34000 [Stentor coeruleus]